MLTLILTLAVLGDSAPDHILYLQNRVDSPQQLAMFEATNALTSCMVAGLGSLYNDGTFTSGCAKGAAGGSVAFVGKLAAAHSYNTPGLGGLGRVVAAVGNSITYAGVHNTAFDSVYVDVGPLGFTLSRNSHWSFTLTPLYAIGMFLLAGDKIDWRNSLYNLTPVFTTRAYNNFAGQTYANVIEYSLNYTPINVAQIVAHEQVHILQWSSFSAFNAFLGPYNWGQDLSYVITTVPNLSTSSYWYNPFELEAYGLVDNRAR